MLTPDQLRELEQMRFGFECYGRRGPKHLEPEIALAAVVACGIAALFALFFMLLLAVLYALHEAIFG